MLKETANTEAVWELAKLFPYQGKWSIEDYLEVESRFGDRLIEFSEGTVEVLPMPSLKHQAYAAFLFKLLLLYVESQHLGIVRFSPTKVQLWEGKIREPDVIYISHKNSDKRTEQWFEAIDLAMEVVGPDDPNRDLFTKRREYARAGIPEYWVIDPRSEEILVLTLPDGESAYGVHGIFGPGRRATSPLLPDFEVDVTALFEQK